MSLPPKFLSKAGDKVLDYERRLRKQGYKIIIGIDEAGRGPLAGPVVAAAVALTKRRFVGVRIDDSKRLTARQREKAFAKIISSCPFALGVVDEKTIDTINIRKATLLAMKQALEKLLEKLDKDKGICLLVDGTDKPETDIPAWAVVKGDRKSPAVACASIVAKVFRDRLMAVYDRIYPQYNFSVHKGYPTVGHFKKIERYGPSPIHRLSFAQLCKK